MVETRYASIISLLVKMLWNSFPTFGGVYGGVPRESMKAPDGGFGSRADVNTNHKLRLLSEVK
jgi:hypothetical protein